MFVMTICCIMGKYSKAPFTFVRQERNKTEDEEEYNGNKYHIRTDNIYRTCTDSISCGCRIKRDPEAGRIRRIKRVRKVEGQTWEKILCNKK